MSSDSLILIVDDNVPDFQAVQRVLRKVGAANPVRHCHNGQEALDFLNENRGKAASEIGIILLDLNMPGVDGREVLKQVKTDDGLKSIPVIIFTTSDSEQDIDSCYESGANSYITKPVDLQALTGVMASLHNYWFGTVKRPIAH